jgi:aminoglycoside phosphotransferase (APT) family kinase protein
MSVELDHAATVRAGEELPEERLRTYLAEHLPNVSGPLQVAQFPHGHSNLTYLISFGETEFVLRRPPFGNQVQTAHDMNREYRVLSKLHSVYAAAPRPLLYCDDLSVLGAPFYIMQRYEGVILRKAIPAGLNVDPELMRSLSRALIDKLAELHSIDYVAAGLTDLGKPAGYVSRQVTGWITRYQKAATDQLAGMDRVAAWLGGHLPAESAAAVIHNDFKFDNLVLDPSDLTRIVAVLDWEMATIGDPWMDLGTTLGYWIQADDPQPLQLAAMGPTGVPGSMTRRELVDRYETATGRSVSHPVFYYCFGLFKIAVIIQQIYARYVRGHTSDPRFARLNQMVAILSQQAERVVEADRI